jgi:hypothetical protein
MTADVPLQGAGVDVEAGTGLVTDDNREGLAAVEGGDIVGHRRSCGGDRDNCNQ